MNTKTTIFIALIFVGFVSAYSKCNDAENAAITECEKKCSPVVLSGGDEDALKTCDAWKCHQYCSNPNNVEGISADCYSEQVSECSASNSNNGCNVECSSATSVAISAVFILALTLFVFIF